MSLVVPSNVPVICGPTAGGKSDLAVALAISLRERFGIAAEILAADAFQVYRGMDIGTAKATSGEQRGVPHHLADLVDPHGSDRDRSGGSGPAATPSPSFTVDNWLRLARTTIAEIRARGRMPIVVGGTHLYIRALVDGLFEGPEPDPALRTELAGMTPGVRRAELERVDPVAAARIHPNDTRRTIRALEVFRLTGKRISEHQEQWDRGPRAPNVGEGARDGGPSTSDASRHIAQPLAPGPLAIAAPGSFLLFILDWDVEALNRRINARVKDMIDRGLLDELRRLVATGPLSSQASEALGYKQLLPVLAGRTALENAIEQIKIETRRLGKNQRTWLRRLRTTPGATALPMPLTTPEQAVEIMLGRIGLASDR